MAEPLLRVQNLVRRFGGITATDNLSLDVADGELHAIIGPNGAGKPADRAGDDEADQPVARGGKSDRLHPGFI